MCDTLNLTIPNATTFLFTGKQKSGKSTLALELVRKRDEIFENKIRKVVYVYTYWQKEFDLFPVVQFITSISEVRNLLEKDSLLIIDDKLSEIIGSENSFTTNLFTCISHHQSVAVVLLIQTFFHPKLRTISLNTDIVCFFNNPRDLQSIIRLGSQFLPGKSLAYEHCMKQHRYMVIDFLKDKENMIRSSLFPSDELTILRAT